MRKLLFFAIVFLIAPYVASQRLPGNVIPEHYSLTFTPDFSSDSFQGEGTIDVQVLAPVSEIVLNAVDLEFHSAVVRTGGEDRTATTTTDANAETVTLKTSAPIPAGSATLRIAYTGKLNDKLHGLYKSTANGRKYAITQFEAVDARVAFPAFDEPAYKATFDISAVVDKEDTAISNGRIVSDSPGPGGKHTIRFATTPKMSTYLVALTVGDWKCLNGEQDGTPIRVCAVPGKEQQGQFALEATKAFLHFYNQYFGIRYPYGKLDQIAAPDFEAGAMENTGAIIYRETDLLLDPAKASLNDQKEVAGVIAHEMAHQWFGDLVTMKWWNDIWLNEGFATWMESKPVAAWKPEWEIAQDEVLNTNQALDTDSVENTRAIRHEALRRNEINSLFDGIAYGKTSAVLRMLEGFIGAETFRAGVNRYLEAHKYANATAEDFWSAMAQSSGQPIDKIMPTFVTQPGAPYLSAEERCEGGETRLRLSQRRFYSLPKLMEESGSELWQIPACVQELGGAATKGCELLLRKQQEFRLKGCGHGLLLNADGSGFYRYSFDADQYRSPNFHAEELSAKDQVSLVGNEGALLAAGIHHVQDVMALATKFKGVTTYAAVSELAAQVRFEDRYLVDDNERAAFKRWVNEVFRPALDKIGMTPKASEPPNQRNLRGVLVGVLGDVGEDPEVIALAKKTVESYMRDPHSVDTTLVDAAFPVAASHGDAALYDGFLVKMKSASSPQDYYRYVHALAAFRDPTLLKRTLEWTLGPDVRNQDLWILVSVLNNPAGQELAWKFVQERFDDIANKAGQSIFGAQFAYYAVGAFCDATSAKQAEKFLELHKVEGLERVGRQQLERVQQCIDLRQREEPNVAGYLQQYASSAGQH